MEQFGDIYLFKVNLNQRNKLEAFVLNNDGSFNIPGDGSSKGCVCHFHHRPIFKKVSVGLDILLLELARISHLSTIDWAEGSKILQRAFPQNSKCSETCWLKTRFCLRLEA